MDILSIIVDVVLIIIIGLLWFLNNENANKQAGYAWLSAFILTLRALLNDIDKL